MKWEIDESKPIHNQIVTEITKCIIKGEYMHDEKIPSVRELAFAAKVNPNTMQKALQELEKNKILITKRTTGKFVTSDETIINNLKKELIDNLVEEFIFELKDYNLTNNEIIELIRRKIENDKM